MNPRPDAPILRPPLVLLVLLLPLLWSAPAPGARWYEDYELAVRILDEGGNCREAIAYLGAAIVDKPKPRLAARTYAARRIDYLPYYQLARAYLACGDVAGAREYLARSREAGVAPAALLGQLEAEIELRSRPTPTPVPTPTRPPREQVEAWTARAERALDAADARLSELAAALRRATAAGSSEPAWRREESALREASSELGRRFRRAREIGDPLELAAVAAAATDLEQRAASLERSIRTALASRAIPAPLPTPTPTPVPPAPTPRPPATVPSPIPTSAPAPPPALRRAARAYLERDYRAVLAALRTVRWDESRLRAAALLLRGAAHAALARTAPPAQAERHRLLAVRDLTAAHEADPELGPDPAIFPPWLLQLWRTSIAP